ncbi:hypothetical protein CTA2_1620 [Colletotrichum tanaceti]|uniref:Baculoviral IAP repeat-containing protein 3 n=1 Tax=Colletotrichum tanaceti TaxID=1306861 RepID=A0A4U6X3K9_9PEZI|nr:hypothetical protein CTA2_1620 [Colletotrichum tanaceti]TKW49951.1 hypothetical protein CTA1_1322 [Colletotrichum tanaceti]
MDEFCVRLLSYFERSEEGEPGRWPHPNPSPEDMTGAGFRLVSTQAKSGDSVVCDFCSLQAWAWEKKDDPYHQHQDGSPKCGYVVTECFRKHQALFLKKQLEKMETKDPLLTPPMTPTKKTYKPRRRMGFSPIVTMYDSKPSHNATRASEEPRESTGKPLEITVSTGETKFVIQVTGAGEHRNTPLSDAVHKSYVEC